MVVHSISRGGSELYVKGGVCREPTLFLQRQDNECYVEHIQDFFVVICNKPHQPSEVYLVNENDVFGNLPWLEGRGNGKGGLIDRCFEQKKVVPLTPQSNSSTMAGPMEKIPDDYRIFDMDVMEVGIAFHPSWDPTF